MKKNNTRNKLNIAVLVLITILVLFFSLKDDFNEVIKEILMVNPWWLFVGMFLILSYFFLRSIDLYYLIRRVNPDYTLKKAVKLTISTQFFNAITPFATGGQPFQIYMLKKDGIRIPEGTNIIVQNFILYQIALVFLGIVALTTNYFCHFYKEIDLLKNLVTFGFAMNFLVIVGLFVISFAKNFNKRLTRFVIDLLTKLKIVKDPDAKKKEWEAYINRFHKGAKILVSDKVYFIQAVSRNVLALICLYLVPLAIVYSMGDYTSLDGIKTIVTSAYVMLIGSFVPIPGGTGGLEYGYVAFFGNFLGGSTLKASMLLWRFFTYYFGMLIGAITFNVKGKK
ncbi:MAG: flippase-like domain-containing protein [Bacilli bacterium]|jgi:uncharacterized protein (TIRG00374 family)|nr:flippase-like domain-containing protein [Bacilli bacterium]